jgi:hypothetical protein
MNLTVVTARLFAFLFFLVSMWAIAAQSAAAPSKYVDVHDFGGTIVNSSGTSGPDGSTTVNVERVTFDNSGDEYGTTYLGGPNGGGLIWERTKSGNYLDLHDFGGSVVNSNGAVGPDGRDPFGCVVLDNAGNLYGTTNEGGPNSDSGMVWELSSAGVYKDLHDFGGQTVTSDGAIGADGSVPYAGVAFDRAGDIYGTTNNGGLNGGGILWELTESGVYSDVHDFGGTVVNADGAAGPDGNQPEDSVTFDNVGDIYGTTLGGGPNESAGMIWELTSTRDYKDLHDFGGTIIDVNGGSGPDGDEGSDSVVLDGLGNLYGTTKHGGPEGDTGIIWELTKAGSYKDLHDFGGTIIITTGSSGPDGYYPYASITFDSHGNMYGTTLQGGPNGVYAGLLWELTAARIYKDLHDFGGTTTDSNGATGPDGAYTPAAIAFDTVGNMYGTTQSGGANSSSGMAWEIVGATNGHQAPEPAISPHGESFEKSIVVSIANSDLLATATILVTTDGSDPSTSPSAQTYAAPFKITASTVVNAIARAPGFGDSVVASSAFTLLPYVQSISVSPVSVIGGVSSTGTVTLNEQAARDTTVSISSNNSAAILPISVVVQAGQTAAQFTIDTSAVPANTVATIKATAGGATKVASLTVRPPSVSALSLKPVAVVGGAMSTGTVTLSGVAAAPVTISLSSTSTAATFPTPSVTVPTGQSTAMFTINTTAVVATTVATIKATGDGAAKGSDLTIKP